MGNWLLNIWQHNMSLLPMGTSFPFPSFCRWSVKVTLFCNEPVHHCWWKRCRISDYKILMLQMIDLNCFCFLWAAKGNISMEYWRPIDQICLPFDREWLDWRRNGWRIMSDYRWYLLFPLSCHQSYVIIKGCCLSFGICRQIMLKQEWGWFTKCLSVPSKWQVW